jgi:hypothetical protein
VLAAGRARAERRSGSKKLALRDRRLESATFGVTGRTKFNGINDSCKLFSD